MSTKKSQTTIWKEKRRRHALKLAKQGWKQKEIAVALDVSNGAVSQWLKVSKQEGRSGLLARAHTGRPPELGKFFLINKGKPPAMPGDSPRFDL